MRVGDVVSHYELLSELGRGGMGVVFRAFDTRLKRSVALKFLPPELSIDGEFQERFIREAQAAAATEHPNICTVYEVGKSEDGHTYISMAFCEGQTLKERLAGGPLEMPVAVDIARQVADGLAAAHRRGIVHRDLKPSNIIVQPGGLVKIVDFGLAKQVGMSDLTRTGSTLGTMAYMSPEQVVGDATDHRTDIWSLGVVLYEMVTGRRLFSGEFQQVIAYAILNDKIEPLSRAVPGTPPRLSSVVACMLERSAAKRYENAEQVSGELTAFLNNISRPSRIRWSVVREAIVRQLSRPAISGGAIAALVLVSALYIRERIRPVREESSVPVPVPVTDTRGLATSPSWSPDGRRVAYSSDEAGNMDIWIRDLEEGTIRQLTTGPSNETHPTWSPDGRRLAFASDDNDSEGGIFVAEVESGRADRVASAGTDPVWSHRGERLVFYQLGNIAILNLSERSPEDVVVEGTDARPHAIWGPNDRHILYWNRVLADINKVDIQSERVYRLGIVPSGYEAAGITLSDDGRLLIVSMGPFGGRKFLWQVRMDPEGLVPVGEPRRIFAEALDEVECELSPDGQRIAYVAMHVDRQLWRFDRDEETGGILDGGVRLTSNSRLNSYPELSPYSETVVWTSQGVGNGALFYLRLTDRVSREARVTARSNVNLREIQASFWPDKGGLLYSSTTGAGYEIWYLGKMDPEGLRLTSNPDSSRDIGPRVSPDGKWIAFYTNRRERNWDIWKIPADSLDEQEPEPLVAWEKSNEMYPAWSPDGASLAFVSNRRGSRDIWQCGVRASEASECHQLTTHLAQDAWPVYSVDGRILYFVSDRDGFLNVWALRIQDRSIFPVTQYRGHDIGLPRDPLMGKFAVSEDAFVLPLERRRGDIMIVDFPS